MSLGGLNAERKPLLLFDLSQTASGQSRANRTAMFSRPACTLNSIGILAGGVLAALTLAVAQAQTVILRGDPPKTELGDQPESVQDNPPNRISIEYVAPQNFELKDLYGRLRDGHALEEIQEILSPFSLSRAAGHQDNGMRQDQFLVQARKS